MGKFSQFIKNNKIYIILLAFILGLNFLAFLGWLSEKKEKPFEQQISETKEPEMGKERLFDKEDIEVRKQKLEKISQEKPILYFLLAAINLTILFVIFIGLILDVYFVLRYFRKESLNIRLIEQDTPRWNLGDVVRVILIFLSAGYFFLIAQGMISGVFPIMKNKNFRMIFDTAILNAVGISVILYFITKKYKQHITAIGLSFKKISESILYALTGYMALIPIIILIMAITYFIIQKIGYKPPVQPIIEVFMEEKETSVLWISALFAAIFGPIAEEIFFRGFMFPAIRKKMGILWGMVITSAIFAFLHTHIVGFLPIMALGMLLAFLYQKTGSLMPSIVVHIIHNVGMVILVFLMRYIGT